VYPGRGLIYDRNHKLLVSNQSAYDLMVIPRQVKNLDTNALCELISITKESFVERMKKAKDYSWVKASVFVKQLSKERYSYFHEKLHNFEGFYPQKRILRDYPDYKNAANVIGYIGEATDAYIKKNKGYVKSDLVGMTGIEKSYEKDLKGKAGIQFKMVDVHNRIKGPYQNGRFDTLPDPGKDVICTIDIDLQKYGEQLMQGKRGSIVAIEPTTGEILALISSPTYNPDLMVGRERTKNYNALYVDSIEKPLFDRALLAEYPPGSPFKVINALIGLQEGTLTPSKSYTCHHGFRYGRLHVACHCGTNYPITLRTSISKSCNNYYCNVFKSVVEKYPTQEGMLRWSEHVKSFGLGKYLNNDLPTGRKGFVPTPDYYNKVDGGTNWKAVRAISLGIGQGELLLTPIQMANMTASIANHGFYYTPHIVKAIGNKSIDDPHYTEPKYTTIDSVHFEEVINGMYDVFEKGTALASKHDSIEMCGKTGTAENPHGQDHSIFTAFAPRKKPKIAIAIIVENGYWGSRWAAPIASLLMEKYITGEVNREALEKRMLDGNLEEEYQKQIDGEYKKQFAELNQ
jgi:penicillin-binding protein 2